MRSTFLVVIGGLFVGMLASSLAVDSVGSARVHAADKGKKSSDGGKSKSDGKNAKGKKKASDSNASLTPLKSASDKLEFLEKIHRSFPARKVDTSFKVEELDRNLRHFMALPPEKYAPAGEAMSR